MRANHPPCEHFSPQRHRLVIPFTLAAVALVGIGWLAPAALLFSVPMFAVILAVVSAGNPGLIVSHEGLQWYALRPRWRFRKVPWDAVVDARRGAFGLGTSIHVVVRSGKYEPWAWGTPELDGQAAIDIWPMALRGGDAVFPTIRNWLSWYDQVTGVGADAHADAPTCSERTTA